MTPAETIAHRLVADSIAHQGNQYVVRLPFKSSERPPTNFAIAKGQLDQLFSLTVIKKLQCFEFTMVPFGTTCSPYLLQFSLQYHFNMEFPHAAVSTSSHLHVFSDALNKAYGTVAYAVCYKAGTSFLVTSKV